MNVVPMDSKGWLWFNSYLPVLAVEDSCGMVAVDSYGQKVAGCVFDNWTNTSVQAHLLILNPFVIRSGFFVCIAEYVFVERRKNMIYSLVPGNNENAIRVNKKLGYSEKCRFEGAFQDGVDYVIMELKKENCKYLREAA